MKAPVQYLGHTEIMADYYGSFGKSSAGTNVQQDFERIYEDALAVKYGKAKRYLAGLDPAQMETIRAFHHLAKDIDIAALDEEGAYNLLVHRYEQLDFDGDGLVKNGIGTMIPAFPQDMPNNLKSSIVDALQQLKNEGLDDFRDISPVTMMLSFKFNAHAMLAQLKDKPGPWENIQLSKPNYDYSVLTEMQENLHHPTGGAYAPQEYVERFDRFMEILDKIIEAKGGDIKSGEATGETAGRKNASQEEDTEVASFFDRVRAAGGAMNFIQQLNMEKIEKMIEEKRRELEGKLGVNAQPPLPPEELERVLKQIEEMLTEYKKNLLEELEKRTHSKHFDKDAFIKQLIHLPPNDEEEA